MCKNPPKYAVGQSVRFKNGTTGRVYTITEIDTRTSRNSVSYRCVYRDNLGKYDDWFYEKDIELDIISVSSLNDSIQEMKMKIDDLQKEIDAKRATRDLLESQGVTEISPRELQALLVLRTLNSDASEIDKAKAVIAALDSKF